MKAATRVRCSVHAKRIYPTQAAAIGAALRNSAKFGCGQRPYRDERCGHWHLTTKPLRWWEGAAA